MKAEVWVRSQVDRLVNVILNTQFKIINSQKKQAVIIRGTHGSVASSTWGKKPLGLHYPDPLAPSTPESLETERLMGAKGWSN